MKTEPNQPATGMIDPFSHAIYTGLTKREAFAKAAMQGFLASLNPEHADWCPNGATMVYIAKQSVTITDLLIAELNKEKT